MFTLIYTKGALADWREGRTTKRLLAHRISNIPSRGVVETFVSNLQAGTPWVALRDGEQVLSGEAA